MRLCADENISESCVFALREVGHDVLWIREKAPGSPDIAVLQIAFDQERILITFDKDFGDLVFRQGANASRGVILFRLSQTGPSAVAERIRTILGSRSDWSNHFSVVDDLSIRMRPLK